jgi:hypothetical protein
MDDQREPLRLDLRISRTGARRRWAGDPNERRASAHWLLDIRESVAAPGFGDTSADALKRVFREVCTIESPDDGLTFLTESVHVEAIREDQEYGGMRVKLMAMLGNVRIPLQVDVGASDAVVPPPEVLDYPGLLDLPRARLRAYRPETSIAEKTEAMVRLALANSRMKDFFDIHRLAETRTFDGETLRLALAATFSRRGIDIPGERPLALTSEFADDAQKKIQWAAFVRRARRPELADLSAIIATLDRFLWRLCSKLQLGEDGGRRCGRTVGRGRSRRMVPCRVVKMRARERSHPVVRLQRVQVPSR